MSDDANTLMRDYEYLWSRQGNFRTLWNQAAQFVMPAWDNFIGEFAEGVNRNTRIFDSTGIIANGRFAAAMEAMLTPRSQKWHKLKPGDENLEDDPECQRWCDTTTKTLFAARYHPEANFASQTDECYMSLGAFGNNALYTDENVGRSLRYRSFPLSELVWSLNHQGQVDTIYRKWKYTVRAAMQDMANGTFSQLPAQVTNAFQKTPYDEQYFLQCIRPNDDFSPGAYGTKGKKFACWYLHFDSRTIIGTGSYRTFPCSVGRYRVAPRENYGRGPAIDCFPDIRTANEMVKTGLRAGQKAVDPPILLAEESVLSNFNQRPGANNYGMMTADGKPLAMPFESKANFELSAEMLEGTRNVVRDTFLNTLFQILVQNPNMTATEALLRAQEKGELIAPAMGRQQSEFLGPLIHRELDILTAAGQIQPMPVSMLRSGKGVDIEYTSPLARALRAEEGSSIMNTVSDMAQMMNLDPTVKQMMDLHAAFRQMAEIRGCPASLIRSDEEVQALMEADAEQAQQQQMMAAAPQVAMGAKNLAQAAQAASQAGTSGGSAGAPGIPQGA